MEEIQSYDGRGFLFWVTDAYGSPQYYQNFDALGHSLKQRPAFTDLNYVFDRAGRVTSVSETANPQKVWKEFTYADSNGANDWRAGKLWTSKRYNYVNVNWKGSTGVVTETFTYGGVNGRVSNYDVSLSDGLGLREAFIQSYTYTELGDIQQITYPTSTIAGSGNLGRTRTVTSNYTVGQVTSVAGDAEFVKRNVGQLYQLPSVMVWSAR